MRFYPDTLPTYDYEPTSENFAIRRFDDNTGEGVVALRSFEPGDIIFRFTGFVLNEITQFSLQLSEGVHIHDPYFMGKVLHSCEPNASCDMETRTFTALKPIEAGACVTMDYGETEDRLFKSFQCSCGAENCRGVVTGRLEALEHA